MTNITGVFNNAQQANKVVADLLSAGLDKSDISLLMSSHAKEHFSSAGDDRGDRAIKDAAMGAGTGGVFAGLVVGLTAVSAITIPGMALVAVGPLLAALEGIGIGAAVGGLTGALASLGVSAMEANKYEAALKEGKAVVVVHTSNEAKLQAARAALASANPGSLAA